jgi:fatty-acid peroxygenase
VIRPVVAIAWYVAFAAHALHNHPRWRDRLAAGDEPGLESFVQEVRRFYPFTPFVGARVRHDFTWQGHHFPAGRLTLLDIYGADHDPTVWDDPGAFRPERFGERAPSAFDLIPQGGGEPPTGHRCPGERLTIDQTKVALRFLTRSVTYAVPAQSFAIPLHRIPARLDDGFVITPTGTA